MNLGRSLELVGAPALTIRRLLALLTMAAIAVGTGDLRADFPNVF
jgi:hypothetical protein